MTSNIQRALDKQAKLEDESTEGPWVSGRYGKCNVIVANFDGTVTDADYFINEADQTTQSDAALIAHLRNQAALARAVIEAADKACWNIEYDANTRLEVALKAWTDHINSEQ